MPSRKRLLFWLALAGALGAFGLLSYSETFRSQFEPLLKWATGLMTASPLLGALIFFLFSLISAMLAFASSVALVPPANLAWGKLITFVLLWGGWLAGAIVAYMIGNFARPLLIRLGYREELEKYQSYVNRRAKFWMVLLFCLAVPSEIPGYVLGSTHYPLSRFVLAMGISEAIYALGIVFAGESLLASRPLPLILIVAGMILLGLFAGTLLRKLRRRRTQRPRV